jgi:hypothetical protein
VRRTIDGKIARFRETRCGVVGGGSTSGALNPVAKDRIIARRRGAHTRREHFERKQATRSAPGIMGQHRIKFGQAVSTVARSIT